jgi:outer membrane protein assembly factor BamA
MNAKLKRSVLCPIIAVLIIPTLLFGAVEQDKREDKTLVIPYARYATENGFVVGVIGNLVFYDVVNEEDTGLFSGSLQYTQKKQGVVSLSTGYQAKEKKYQAGLDFDYKHWPDNFYGIGSSSLLHNKETYISKKFEVAGSVRKKTYSAWSLGLHTDYGNYSLDLNEKNAILDQGSITGSDGGEAFGVGISLNKDSRNSLFFPTDGEYLELRVNHFEDRLIGDFAFNSVTLDYRRFFGINKWQSVSLQGFTGVERGDVPFQKMYQLGNYLRGYSRSRYIDANITAVRSEYRLFPFDGKFASRIGFVIFPEIGSVFSNFDDWSISDFKVSYGFGVRFKALKGDSPLLRIDLGLTPESYNIIAIGSEAF